MQNIGKLFGVIVCDSQAKWGGPQGISQRIQDMMRENGERWMTFIAEHGEFPTEDELKNFQGIYIAGSKSSVNDENQPWIQQLETFIQQAYDLKKPKISGICFGHQAIAKALGGRVAKNPSKKFVCCNEEIVISDNENRSSFLHKLRAISEKKPLRILASHGECVVELPKGARSVASSVSCNHEIVLYSENIIGIQSHPDFVIEDLSDIILPSLLDGNIFTKEEYEAAKESLKMPNVCSDVAKAVCDFLKC